MVSMIVLLTLGRRRRRRVLSVATVLLLLNEVSLCLGLSLRLSLSLLLLRSAHRRVHGICRRGGLRGVPVGHRVARRRHGLRLRTRCHAPCRSLRVGAVGLRALRCRLLLLVRELLLCLLLRLLRLRRGRAMGG